MYSYADALAYAKVVARKTGQPAYVRENRNNGFFVSDHSPTTNKGIGPVLAVVECKTVIREFSEAAMRKAA